MAIYHLEGTMKSRAEHLAWCKERALAELERGDEGMETISRAIASMGSDLSKHPELEKHIGIDLGMMLLLGGQMRTLRAVREWIEGFN